jgi:hypothetical protein
MENLDPRHRPGGGRLEAGEKRGANATRRVCRREEALLRVCSVRTRLYEGIDFIVSMKKKNFFPFFLFFYFCFRVVNLEDCHQKGRIFSFFFLVPPCAVKS